MNHFNEEALIEYHYGESASSAEIAHHLRECSDCARSYAAIMRDLAEISAPSTPIRDAEYSSQVWDSVRGSLRAYPESRKRSWSSLLPGQQWKGFAAAAVCLLVIAAAFFAGRSWEHSKKQGKDTASNNGGRQRVVLLVVGDHLERSERLLVELRHADSEMEAPLQAEARELLSDNRLYRESVKQGGGDPTLVSALDHLERVLIEVSNEPAGLTQVRLDELQKEMNTDGLLFEVRVLRSRVQGDVDHKESAPLKTKGVSI
jgi:hypothetical protein